MERLRGVVAQHGVVVHLSWAVAWTGVFAAVAIVIGGDDPQGHWVLLGLVLVGMSHLLFQVGRWAERAGRPNPLARRSAVFAWLLPVSRDRNTPAQQAGPA